MAGLPYLLWIVIFVSSLPFSPSRSLPSQKGRTFREAHWTSLYT
jgi:hypothetical protein